LSQSALKEGWKVGWTECCVVVVIVVVVVVVALVG